MIKVGEIGSEATPPGARGSDCHGPAVVARSGLSVKEVTRILNSIQAGNPQAAEELIPLVYDELRALAAYRMAQEQGGQTLQATALVHEAYLRLIGGAPQSWNSRGHFFAAAAEAMRRILIERARRRASRKHGGGWARVDWDEVQVATEAGDDQLLAIDEALVRLEERDPEAARLVKLRFFVGLTAVEAAEAMGMPERTATRAWAYARVWLLKELKKSELTDHV
jgi:RNA polymerase sigma factor (TIGR02999 family)